MGKFKEKCPVCGRTVRAGNFCEWCGEKMVEVCDCWIAGRKINCGRSQCPTAWKDKKKLFTNRVET